MTTAAMEQELRRKVAAGIHLVSEGFERYRVFTPFQLDDGDHLSIVLRKEGEGWVFSDEAHTYMHLSYDIDLADLHKGARQKIISNTLSMFGIRDREGELVIAVPENDYGNSLYSFVQGLLKISDVSFLRRERTRSAFLGDFQELFTTIVPADRRQFEWHDLERDPQGKYTVDCRINGMPNPIFVHALANDRRTRDATIALLTFLKWKMSFRSVAVFEDRRSIGKKVLGRFNDVCDKQFTNLSASHEEIRRYLEPEL